MISELRRRFTPPHAPHPTPSPRAPRPTSSPDEVPTEVAWLPASKHAHSVAHGILEEDTAIETAYAAEVFSESFGVHVALLCAAVAVTPASFLAQSVSVVASVARIVLHLRLEGSMATCAAVSSAHMQTVCEIGEPTLTGLFALLVALQALPAEQPVATLSVGVRSVWLVLVGMWAHTWARPIRHRRLLFFVAATCHVAAAAAAAAAIVWADGALEALEASAAEARIVTLGSVAVGLACGSQFEASRRAAFTWRRRMRSHSASEALADSRLNHILRNKTTAASYLIERVQGELRVHSARQSTRGSRGAGGEGGAAEGCMRDAATGAGPGSAAIGSAGSASSPTRASTASRVFSSSGLDEGAHSVAPLRAPLREPLAVRTSGEVATVSALPAASSSGSGGGGGEGEGAPVVLSHSMARWMHRRLEAVKGIVRQNAEWIHMRELVLQLQRGTCRSTMLLTDVHAVLQRFNGQTPMVRLEAAALLRWLFVDANILQLCLEQSYSNARALTAEGTTIVLVATCERKSPAAALAATLATSAESAAEATAASTIEAKVGRSDERLYLHICLDSINRRIDDSNYTTLSNSFKLSAPPLGQSAVELHAPAVEPLLASEEWCSYGDGLGLDIMRRATAVAGGGAFVTTYVTGEETHTVQHIVLPCHARAADGDGVVASFSPNASPGNVSSSVAADSGDGLTPEMPLKRPLIYAVRPRASALHPCTLDANLPTTCAFTGGR